MAICTILFNHTALYGTSSHTCTGTAKNIYKCTCTVSFVYLTIFVCKALVIFGLLAFFALPRQHRKIARLVGSHSKIIFSSLNIAPNSIYSKYAKYKNVLVLSKNESIIWATLVYLPTIWHWGFMGGLVGLDKRG